MRSCEVGESKKKYVEEDSLKVICSPPLIINVFRKGHETYQTIYANFFSADLPINITLPCKRSDKFSEFEEKLYQYHPELRYNKLDFIHHGDFINRHLTIDENDINDGDRIFIIKII